MLRWNILMNETVLRPFQVVFLTAQMIFAMQFESWNGLQMQMTMMNIELGH